jgi:hypothetical protein
MPPGECLKSQLKKSLPPGGSGLGRGRKKKWLENGLKVSLVEVNNLLNLTF